MRFIVLMGLLLGGVTLAADEAPGATTDIDRAYSDETIRIYTLTLEGRTMSRQQVEEAEARLVEHPEDIETRYRLLGFYRGKLNTRMFTAKRPHVLWLIENRPDDPLFGTRLIDLKMPLEKETYIAGAAAFDKQIEAHPENARILGNAARFSVGIDREIVVGMLERARQLEPENPEWPRRMASVHQIMAFHSTKPQIFEMAYAEWMNAYELLDADEKLMLLPQLAKTGLNAGRLDEAKAWAVKALDSVEKLEPRNRHGEAISVAHTVLGRLALKRGDLEAAKRHLLASAQTPGSPKLNSIGPNLQLAHLLAKEGQAETVIEYLQACRVFWNSGRSRIDEWVRILKEGDTPFFGDNLKL